MFDYTQEYTMDVPIVRCLGVEQCSAIFCKKPPSVNRFEYFGPNVSNFAARSRHFNSFIVGYVDAKSQENLTRESMGFL